MCNKLPQNIMGACLGKKVDTGIALQQAIHDDYVKHQQKIKLLLLGTRRTSSIRLPLRLLLAAPRPALEQGLGFVRPPQLPPPSWLDLTLNSHYRSW